MDRPAAMILDSHTHIFPEAVRRNRTSFCEDDEDFSSIYLNPKAKMIGVEELIASMDETGVDVSLICGFSWKRLDFCQIHNRYLLEAVSRYPRRLIAFLTLPFSDPDGSLEELERGIREGGKGVGEIAFYGRELSPQDLNRMKPVLTLMEKKGIPLLLHANETIGHSYPGKGKTPLSRFYELAAAYPKLPIILAHWGGGLLFYELMPEAAKTLTNVFYDTAASPFLYSKAIYSVGSQIVGAEKILFGSDFPLLSPRRYFEEIEASGMNRSDQQKILGLNLARLLGVDRRGFDAA